MNGRTTYGGGKVTDGNGSGVSFAAGFDLARRLRDPSFRSYLKKSGWQSGQHIVVASDDEPVIEVVAKMILHDTGGRAFIAIPTDKEEMGFCLLSVEVEHSERADEDSIILDPASSIGMLYSSLISCAAYVPSQWTRTLRFERIQAAA